MIRFFALGLLAVVVFMPSQAAFGQPALDELERQVRSAGQRPEPRRTDDPKIGYLGVVADDTPGHDGVRLVEVIPGSPAAAAGLETGDAVTAVDDQDVRTLADFADRVTGVSVGGRLRIDVLRGGKPQSIAVVLGTRPPTAARRFEQFGPVGAGDDERGEGRSIAALGIRVATLTEEYRKAHDVQTVSGARIVALVRGLPADAAGLRLGSIIVAVDGREVTSAEQLIERVADKQPGSAVALTYYFDGRKGEASLRLPAGAVPPVGAAVPPGAPPVRGGGSVEARIAGLEQRLDRIERLLDKLLAAQNDELPPPKPSKEDAPK